MTPGWSQKVESRCMCPGSSGQCLLPAVGTHSPLSVSTCAQCNAVGAERMYKVM